MTEHDALLAAVLAGPADDLPRLLYADWCDDRGDADRAELVRVQVAAARLPAADPRRDALDDRARELLAGGFERWKVPGVRGVQEFDRGFVAAWAGSGDWFLAAADRLFTAAPVTAVRLRVVEGRVSRLVRVAALGRVEHLDLSSTLLAAGSRLERLLAEAPLGRLRSLAVGNNRLFADALPQIAGSPVARRLTALDLSGNPLADDGLEALADSARFPRLETLTVRCNEQGDEDSVHADGATAFALTDHYPRLRELDLSGHRVGDAGLAALVDSPLGRRLAVLRLARNGIGADGDGWAERLVRTALPPGDRLLDLSGRRNAVSPRAATWLRDWMKLASGTTIDLRGCNLSPAAYHTLASSPYAGRGLLLDPHPPAEEPS